MTDLTIKPLLFSQPQLEQRLLKTAKEKMEQLSRALSGSECSNVFTYFILTS